jgi:pSer/pThr/pTyr-binding forkhead associated (FHA) protein
VLDLPSISRHHAVVHVSGSHAAVEDLRSKNGTFVGNGRVETSRELRDGDTVRFGTVCGVFRAVSMGATTVSDPAQDLAGS